MKSVILEKDEKVAEITLNRPEVHNALNMDMVKELSAALDDCWKDDDIKVIVLKGAGKSFSSGADLKQFMRFAAGEGNSAEYGLELHFGVVKKMREIPKPIIAEVKGYSIGGGVGLVAASDYAIAAESAVFSCGYVLIGLSPDTGTSFLIPRGASMKRAFELMSTGRRFSAREALQYGIVTEVVPDEKLRERVKEVVEIYLNRPREAIANLKRLLNITHSNKIDEQLALELNFVSMATLTKDFIEGVTAMLEKREARFD
ncbi:MAG: enoyl-CoA hydratase/isomerase family protein [Archaeoglobus sp.]|uniref:enoyl-CoA hydratase/isomerase family protein n=1 Tax=Archaeoglobus sp. TaxID=1872626 RepID=UPI001DF8ACDE|nr:enoyl-CoA hydratase/isomerase family protein [Archaeoglobus sp.]MBO8180001.1 enoyl-CoA hydratase/isomerase family protein [Archaeoglobus sp.]